MRTLLILALLALPCLALAGDAQAPVAQADSQKTLAQMREQRVKGIERLRAQIAEFETRATIETDKAKDLLRAAAVERKNVEKLTQELARIDALLAPKMPEAVVAAAEAKVKEAEAALEAAKKELAEAKAALEKAKPPEGKANG